MFGASSDTMGTLDRLRSTPGSIVVLLGGLLLVRTAGFAYLFLAYLLNARGHGPTAIEAALATFGAGWVLGQPMCGWLIDRIGRRSTLVAFMALGAVGLPVLGTSSATAAILSGSFLAGMIYDAPRPVISAAVTGLIEDEGHRAWLNGWRHFVLNAGGALAGGLGGLLIGPLGVPALYWINAAACAVFAVLVLQYVPVDVPVPPGAQRRSYLTAFTDARLWVVVISSLGTLIPLLATFASIPLLMTIDRLPPSDLGTIQLAACAAVLVLTPLLTPWLSRRADSPRPMLAEVIASSAFLGITMGGIGYASTSIGYGLAVVASIPGEVVWFVAISDVLNRIAPVQALGIYNGVWGMALAGASVVTPLLTAWALEHGGKPIVGAVIAAAGLAGAACILTLSPRETTSRSTPPRRPHASDQ